MRTNNFVGVVEQQHNTRGTSDQQGPLERGGEASEIERRVWKIDIYLWVAFGISVAAAGLEKVWSVFSGFTLLIGPFPAMTLALALIFGGAAILVNMPAPQLPAAAPRAAFASDTSVRTAQRPAAQRSRSARRVMEMEI